MLSEIFKPIVDEKVPDGTIVIRNEWGQEIGEIINVEEKRTVRIIEKGK